MEKPLKESYRIIEAAEILASGDPTKKKEILKRIELDRYSDILNFALTLKPRTNKEWPPMSVALEQYRISREEFLSYKKSILEDMGSEKQAETKPKYLFRKWNEEKDHIRFDILFDGFEWLGLKSIGAAYVHHYIKEKPRRFLNEEVYDEVRKTFFQYNRYPSADPNYDEDNRKQSEGQTLFGKQSKGDPTTLKNLKEEWDERKKELREAEECYDPGRIERTKKELKDFEKHFSQYSRKGKPKFFSDTPQMKKSSEVKQEVYRFIRSLKAKPEAKAFYDHLSGAFKPVHGRTKQYSPKDPVDWVLE